MRDWRIMLYEKIAHLFENDTSLCGQRRRTEEGLLALEPEKDGCLPCAVARIRALEKQRDELQAFARDVGEGRA